LVSEVARDLRGRDDEGASPQSGDGTQVLIAWLRDYMKVEAFSLAPEFTPVLGCYVEEVRPNASGD
jgi:hypothetical protein